jgi:hypothetical protein
MIMHCHAETVQSNVPEKSTTKKDYCSGPIMWPSWPPDLRPLDFCLGGYVKDAVYIPPFQQPYITYVNESQMLLHKLMQICLGIYGIK